MDSLTTITATKATIASNLERTSASSDDDNSRLLVRDVVVARELASKEDYPSLESRSIGGQRQSSSRCQQGIMRLRRHFGRVQFHIFLLLYFHHQNLVADAKGLVGKLPGNPASCPDEPCNSDPQHVLNALKWTSLGFGLILLLPLLMYYLSKLVSKIRSMWCSNGDVKKRKKKDLDDDDVACDVDDEEDDEEEEEDYEEEEDEDVRRGQDQDKLSLGSQASNEPARQRGPPSNKRMSSACIGQTPMGAEKQSILSANKHQQQLMPPIKAEANAGRKRSSQAQVGAGESTPGSEKTKLNLDYEDQNRKLAQMLSDSSQLFLEQSAANQRHLQQQQHRNSLIKNGQIELQPQPSRKKPQAGQPGTRFLVRAHSRSLRARPGSGRPRGSSHAFVGGFRQVYPVADQVEQSGGSGNRGRIGSPAGAEFGIQPEGGEISVVSQLYQQQQQLHNILTVPQVAQHRHSIDSSILNSMVHQQSEQQRQLRQIDCDIEAMAVAAMCGHDAASSKQLQRRRGQSMGRESGNGKRRPKLLPSLPAAAAASSSSTVSPTTTTTAACHSPIALMAPRNQQQQQRPRRPSLNPAARAN